MCIRPSGTSQSLRFHIQLRDADVKKSNLKARRIAIEKRINAIFEDVGKKLDVDWDE